MSRDVYWAGKSGGGQWSFFSKRTVFIYFFSKIIFVFKKLKMVHIKIIPYNFWAF